MKSPYENIQALRARIDEIDREIVSLLAERFRITDEIGTYKKAHGLPAVDELRERVQFQRITRLAEEIGLDPDIAVRILRSVIDEVVGRHRKV